MGGFLDKPVTEKKTETLTSNQYDVSTCEMQGWRRYMEDSKIVELSLPGYPDIALFGVFDGHGGDEVARFVAKYFVKEFVKRQSLKENKIGLALKETFIQMDLILKTPDAINEQIAFKKETTNDPNVTKEQLQSGCTAIVVAITKNKIYAANAGDSRAVLLEGGKTIPLSEDHKPQDEGEKKRIIAAGGQVIEGRVNGNLNLSRSLGDFAYKSVPKVPFHMQPITCLPDIKEVDRTGKQQFLVLACDGIWERYVTNMEPFMERVKNGLSNNQSGQQVLKEFFDFNISKAMAEPNGKDNMTAILIRFK